MSAKTDDRGDGHGSHGRSPREWEDLLSAPLAAGDHAALEQVLREMGAELKAEREIQRAHDHGPLLARPLVVGPRVLRCLNFSLLLSSARLMESAPPAPR